MSKELEKCRNCQNLMEPSHKYCYACGQLVKSHTDSVGEFVSHFLNDYFAYDSKFSASMRPLIWSPGALTVDFMAGKRVRYIPPMRMYIFISFFFFVLIALFSKSTEAVNGESSSDFFSTWIPRIFFLGLPIFALFQNWFFRKKGLGYVPAFVFSLHFHSFVFLSLSLYALLSWTFIKIGLPEANIWLLLIWLLTALVYLYVALKRLYGRGFWGNLLRLIALILCYGSFITFLSMLALLFFK